MYMERLHWSKNFSMVTEVSIAGDFLYDAITHLNATENLDNISGVFRFLYNASVGIERLQKALIIITECESEEHLIEFVESITTHSLTSLHQRIEKQRKIGFNSAQIGFLHLLTSFYKNHRYNRFALPNKLNAERDALKKFLKEQGKLTAKDTPFLATYFDEDSKKFLTNLIGVIAQKYYDNLQDVCRQKNLYSYELQWDSPAAKIFRFDSKLSAQIADEKTALKELILFLAHITVKKGGFPRYLRTHKPLNLERASIPEHLHDIINGVIPQSLIDEVATIYEDRFDTNQKRKKRAEIIDPIGNPYVDWDFRRPLCRLRFRRRDKEEG